MNNPQRMKNEKGFTLVEILASIVILFIILVFFYSMFVQSATVNNRSENIIDATYVAQSIMEEIYDVSSNYNFPDGKNYMDERINYDFKLKENNWEIYQKTWSDYTINVRFKESENNLFRVIVEVYDGDDSNRIQAKMENALFWGR